MFLPLLYASVVAGAIATLVMVARLYLPALFGARPYDVFGAVGA